MRLSGKIALITGTSPNIGGGIAEGLAHEGAAIIAVDARPENAADCAGAIEAAGGQALGLTCDVGDEDQVRRTVAAGLAAFGRIDILINNAGIIRWAGFPDADEDNLASHLAVHVGGSFNTARAAWPHMVEAGYGRMVMTTSAGLFGLPTNLSYATAKGAVIGMVRSLRTAGARHGIKVNLIAPAAVTRMAGTPTDDLAAQMSPDLVAPMVALLAHEACPVSGEIYAAGAGRFARIFIASTRGYVHPTPEPTIEDLATNWAAINDEPGYYVPADLGDWSATFMTHLS
jgi:NAD(P)-dependent dehydrogenase (short-subunit alcohol dehydrogenase family)